MSLSRSDADRSRPADHIDQAATAETVAGPPLGPVGWVRWGWRQLTSMRTAIVLLLLLALAAVPGSVFPQRSADPNGVAQWFRDNPDVAPVLDWFQLFDLYSSSWFSAIYLLLFISLIGCVIPRTRHHLKALRAAPPRTPARLSRLDNHRQDTVDGGEDPDAVASRAVEIATEQLRSRGYRVKRYDARGSWSVSAERGYARETGNLIFHGALIGVLVAVLVGSGFTYTGQRVIVEGTTFVNALSDYSSFNPGRFIDGTGLTPYSMTLDTFGVEYQPPRSAGAGQAGDFAAAVTIRTPATDETRAETVRVNAPLTVGNDRIFLLGNGYAPTITVRNGDGDVVYSDSQPFLPQDSMMTSLGIIKVPDGLPEQIGLVGFFYPTQGALPTGAYTSIYPDLFNPVVTFNVFSGSLGIDDGTPRSVYTLDTSGMAQLTGGDTGSDSIELNPGQTADLPNGWGTVTFEDASAGTDPLAAVKRFASLQIQHDPGATWVLVFAVIATLGLMAGLFIPRRRVWVKVTPEPLGEAGTLRVEYAGLARGEDPQLDPAVSQLRDAHLTAIGNLIPPPTREENT
ncbi:cytochrome C biogenesis protein [Microbacterium sp. Gd 4-13]|uniref:cytochrome c biogenesis protein ResB n=1 Tax=Microbacterium sp. Gd 4-13 TaxID=2173179 RepID=UPI000D573CE4|nr:cytochrome c biogenesis protein ResB [Microbacterium sp. Gd 4-13]PVW02019.1 cytochrome C biogenesis protein [Microbacterium sp. Gd 4-13]